MIGFLPPWLAMAGAAFCPSQTAVVVACRRLVPSWLVPTAFVLAVGTCAAG